MNIFIGLLLLILVILIGSSVFRKAEERRRREERERKEAEAKRLDECEEVIRFYANEHGDVARMAVSKEELTRLIETGVSARELEAFISERIDKTEGIELGIQFTDGERIPVILPDQYRDKHVYVIGKSGYGKSNLLKFMILQDMNAGHGIGVLAPEIEMLNDELLPFIPSDRIEDIIYFNPADIDCPVVLNPLHIEPGDDIDLHVDETFTVLQRVVGEGGPRMDEILRHSLYALIERKGSTLLDIEVLLDRQSPTLRDEIIENTQNERTRKFFKQTYLQFPKESHFPITNRIGRIVGTKFARNCLCPPLHTSLSVEESSRRLLNIRRAMDERKILLFNLSDGILGEAASQMIGQFIVSKFQTATMSRADIGKTHRIPFYLYLDEFQNFCGTASKSYEKILSRARKYRLGLILAHQQTGQLPPELLREIFGNVSVMVSFQVSQSDAARLSREFMMQHDYDFEALPPEELLRLNIGDAFCKIGRSTFPMHVPLVDRPPVQWRAKEVIESSRSKYGIPRIKLPDSDTPKKPTRGNDSLSDIDPEGVFE